MSAERGGNIDMEARLHDIQSAVGTFHLHPGLGGGESDSGHEVVFGDLVGYGNVAVKPFVGKSGEGRAWQEAGMLEEVARRGFETLDPVDVAKGSLATYLVTSRRPGLHHLGQLTWNDGITSRQLRTLIIPSLTAAADTIGSLSAAGINHGDFQPKNAVFDRSGAPVIVDLERSQRDHPPNEHSKRFDHDVWLFGEMAFYKGLLADRSPRYRADWMEEKFLAPAYAAASPGARGGEETMNIRVEKIKDEWKQKIEKKELHAGISGSRRRQRRIDPKEIELRISRRRRHRKAA
jgi:hypothetical protein